MLHCPIFDKDLSWLEFNYRVLQEAMDRTNPVIERARFLGIYSNAPRYLTTITRVTQLYICGLLLVRFNPLRVDIKFTDFDKQLVFSAAIFMFFTLVANVFANYLQNVKSYIEQPDKIGRFLDVNFN